MVNPKFLALQVFEGIIKLKKHKAVAVSDGLNFLSNYNLLFSKYKVKFSNAVLLFSSKNILLKQP